VNPAGSTSISVRVGTHASFFESLRRRLSSQDYPQLAALKARETSDPSIAMLDAWAAAGDVLTFYNERFINEGYLRTATERRSLAELSGLIGYRPGPGVASSVYLAFTLEKDPKQASGQTLIPKGTAVKSVPTDGEMPQTFETMEDLPARPEWNAMKPRLTIPQLVASTSNIESLFLDGADFQIKPNDHILLQLGRGGGSVELTIQDVRIDSTNKVTELVLGETLFSVRRLNRQVSTRVDNFLSLAESLTGFTWLNDKAADPLRKLKSGYGLVLTLPMNKWNRLSEYDDQITAWLKSVPETNPAIAKTELAKIDSIFNTLTKTLGTGIEDGSKQLIKDAQTICDEVLLLDERAIKFCAAADHAALIAEGGVPAVTQLTSPQQQLQNLFNVLPADFTVAQRKLKTWWGIKPAMGGLTVRAQDLNAIFAKLKSDLTPTSTYPHTNALGMIFQASSDVSDLSPSGGSPAQGRIDNLRDSVAGQAYAEELDAIVTLSPIPTSTILLQLDEQLLKPIRTEPKPSEKHKLAVERVQKENDTLAIAAAALDLADLLAVFPEFINARRKLFADEAKKILRDFDSLGTETDVAVKNDWTSVINVLNKAQETVNATNVYSTQLNTTMAAIGNDSSGLVQLISSISIPGNLNLTRKLEDLARELRRLNALNGGSGPNVPSPPQTPTTGGGIGQVARLEGEVVTRSGNEVLHRVADEVLSIPTNTAADVVAQLAASFGLVSREELKAKWAAVKNGDQEATAALLSPPISLFGHNAPRQVFSANLTINVDATDWPAKLDTNPIDYTGQVFLNAEVQSISTPSQFFLRMMGQDDQRLPMRDAQIVSRSDYGLTQKVTQIDLDDTETNWTKSWRPSPDPDPNSISYLRKTIAIVPIKNLPLAESRLIATIGKEADGSGLSLAHEFAAETNQIELDGIYLGLRPGQWIAVQGERSASPGVISHELCRITYVRHKLRKLPGDTVHTRIFLDRGLEHTYRRDTVTIYANVARATHGETVTQHALGSGDASQVFQAMPMVRGPLTYLPAATPSGIESTLTLRVKNLRWHEKDSLLESASSDRDFSVHTDETSRSSVQFGDGKTGARLPTGRENVQAQYRVGLGSAGNVKAGAITQLAGNKPLGLKEVINPLPATGGAGPENADQIRSNASLAVMALDRLVSVRDYADFARNYAAIEKAIARRFLVGGQPTVHVTIAGAGDIPIAEDSELLGHLQQAFRKLGDRLQVVRIETRELLLIFLSVRIRILTDHDWASVESAVRTQLYETLGFPRQELSQDVYLSKVHAAIQSVEGVAYVDVEVFAPLDQRKFEDALKKSATSGTGGNPLDDVFKSLLASTGLPKPKIPVLSSRVVGGGIRPAQIAYLSPDVPDSLFITEIK